MKKAAVGELKKNLDRYLDRVKGGESVLVVDRDEPIAEIMPLRKASRGTGSPIGRLARLERKGLIRHGSSDHDQWLLKHRPVKIVGSVLQDLLDERRSGW